MIIRRAVTWLLLLVAGVAIEPGDAAWAEEKPAAEPGPSAAASAGAHKDVPATGSLLAAPSVEQLVERARESIAVIRVSGRDGTDAGLGTGFVVSSDGLIATNLHVIGEARPIWVQFGDGRRHEVAAVEASDQALDLAVLRIEAGGLKPLVLGDSGTLKPGQAIVALGNPQGLEHSVVTGVVSGERQIDGRPMIQLAIPIEPGNSGGPLMDLEGRVHGILTLKSAVTANLGFAVRIDALRRLLDKPNPVPMARWLTIGALDAQDWTAVFGARWRQRAGRITVDSPGRGFGGRSLCLWRHDVPQRPFEVAVAVRLGDESGAAGLVFGADGGDRHYGFYPSGGRLRLARFDGPDVHSWNVLAEVSSSHYRAGQWNTLKVRLERDRIVCFVNDEQVIESHDAVYTTGQAGLARFRDTLAEFKGFRVARKIAPSMPPADVVRRIDELIGPGPGDEPLEVDAFTAMLPDGSQAADLLHARADALLRHAAALRQMADQLHRRQVVAELQAALSQPDEAIDLLRAALLVARLDNREVNVDAYCGEVDRMARAITADLADHADEPVRLSALTTYLFQDNGFHGSRNDYYNRANSYLNEVIDDREGLPISLSVLFIELAARLDLHVEGIGLPGHFIVRHVPKQGRPQLIDPFEGGKPVTRAEAALRVLEHAGRPLRAEDLVAAPKRAIIVRMLRNLLGVATSESKPDEMLSYLDAILAIEPGSIDDRSMRAVVRFQAGQKSAARDDVDWLLEHPAEGLDIDRLLDFRRMLER